MRDELLELLSPEDTAELLDDEEFSWQLDQATAYFVEEATVRNLAGPADDNAACDELVEGECSDSEPAFEQAMRERW